VILIAGRVKRKQRQKRGRIFYNKTEAGIFIAIVVMMFGLFLIPSMRSSNLFSATGLVPDLGLPIINSVGVNESDNFYSNCAGNNDVHIVADVSNALQVAANFSGISPLIDCGDSGIVSLTNSGGNIWEGDCDVSNAAMASNFVGGPVVLVAANVNGPVIDTSLNIILYNMTTPPMPEGCDRFGPKTTNMCDVTDFHAVNFVTEIETNGTCKSQEIGQDLPWTGFKPVVMFNFSSVDMTGEGIGDELAAIGSALHVQITPPGQFGDSVVGVNVDAFNALNTETKISLYGLPFATEPTIFPNDGVSVDNFTLNEPYEIMPNDAADCEGICGDEGYCPGENCDACMTQCQAFVTYVPNSDLSFTVGHFSDYNVGDTELPTVEITSPPDSGTVFTPFTASAIVNGTGSQLNEIDFYVDDNLVCSYGYLDIFSKCTNLTADWSDVNCPCNITWPPGWHTLKVAARDLGGVSGNYNEASVGFDVIGCGSTINSNLTMINDLACSGGDGLVIGSNDITLDCAGHVINGSGSNAIVLNSVSGVTVKNCDVSGFNRGIYLTGGANNNLIFNNSAHDNNQNDIELRNGPDNNTVSYNTVSRGHMVGINLKSTTNNFIHDNTVTSNSAAGIRLSTSSGNEVYDNTITNTTAGIGNGIDFSSATGNNIHDNTIRSNKVGIFSASSTDNTLKNNDIRKNCDGIKLMSSSATNIYNNTIAENGINAIGNCIGAEGTGIYVDSSSETHIRDGSVTNNGPFGIIADGYVEWIPYESSATCTNNALYLNDGRSVAPLVTRTNCPVVPDESAEGAPSCGDTITEDLTLAQPMICSGDYGLQVGANDITIDCNNFGLKGSGSGIGIYNNGYSGVTIKNCVISDFNNGIYVNSADVNTIKDNIVNNNRGSGIYINGGGIASNHVITGNTVNGNDQNCGNGCGGIELNYEDNSTIQDNEVLNNYNGISLFESYNNRISSNTLSGNHNIEMRIASNNNANNGGSNIINGNTITGIGGWSGIRVGTPNNTVTENNIACDDSGNGIDLYSRWLEPDGNYFSGNDVSGCTYGFYATGYSGWSYYPLNIFTIEGDNYHDNSNSGIYLYYVGGEEMPAISNTEVYNNTHGVWLASSYANITDTHFNDNSGSEGLTGLHVDPSSTAYLTNGNFVNNGQWGIYDLVLNHVYWVINGSAKCINNNIVMQTGGQNITFDGGVLELGNCTIFIDGAGTGINLTGKIKSLQRIEESIIANISTEIGSIDADTNITLYLANDVATTITVAATTPNSTPTNSLTTLKGIEISVDSTTSGELTWALIKIFYNDSELAAANIDESTLKIYFYNTTTGFWQPEPNQGVDIVNNYIWANVTHFSLFGVFGSLVASPVLPSIPAGGGGGGCYSVWRCSDWSECYANSTQYRTCSDIVCGLQDKGEWQNCTNAAPEALPAPLQPPSTEVPAPIPSEMPAPTGPVCGNRICEYGESSASCPADCGTAPVPRFITPAIGTFSGTDVIVLAGAASAVAALMIVILLRRYMTRRKRGYKFAKTVPALAQSARLGRSKKQESKCYICGKPSLLVHTCALCGRETCYDHIKFVKNEAVCQRCMSRMGKKRK